MNTCTSCGKIKLGNSVMQGCACQNSMQAPPAAAQREWVGLTRKEVYVLYDSDFETFHQRIEAKLKEKNT